MSNGLCRAAAAVMLLILAVPVYGEQALTNAIDAYVAPLAAAGQVSGTLLVAKGDRVLYERSFGKADYENDVAYTPETPSCVASITKSMTILVAVKLLEAGALSTDDPLSRFLPDFPEGERITFLHLLRHRAGLPHRVTTDAEEAKPITSEGMVARVAAYVARHGLLCEPGEVSIYGSAGYSVAARVCELATGSTFGELLHEHVFVPAGMTNTFDPGPGGELPFHAPSYTASWPGVTKAGDKDYAFLVGAGSVFSTARDVFRFVRAVADTVYGRSVRASLVRDGGFQENGVTNGYRAFAVYDEASDVAVVFTGNLQTGAIDWLRRDIPRIASGESVATPEIPDVVKVGITPEETARLLGPWVREKGADFDVTAKDGALYAGWYALIPTSDTTFFSPQDYRTVTFIIENDRAVRIEWQSDDEPMVWTRAEP